MAGRIPYRLVISLEDGDVQYSIRSDGFNLKQAVGAAGKHASSSCKTGVQASF